jgi:hypothetical protein
MSAPVIDRPTLDAVLPLVAAYRSIPGNEQGGSLHIVLEDGNLRRRDIAWCREYARERGDEEGVMLAELLLALSLSQRRRLYRRQA